MSAKIYVQPNIMLIAALEILACMNQCNIHGGGGRSGGGGEKGILQFDISNAFNLPFVYFLVLAVCPCDLRLV